MKSSSTHTLLKICPLSSKGRWQRLVFCRGGHLRPWCPCLARNLSSPIPYFVKASLLRLREVVASIHELEKETDHPLRLCSQQPALYLQGWKLTSDKYSQLVDEMLEWSANVLHAQLAQSSSACQPDRAHLWRQRRYNWANLFLAAKAGRTLLHWDTLATHSDMAMLQGHKFIVLFPPEASESISRSCGEQVNSSRSILLWQRQAFPSEPARPELGHLCSRLVQDRNCQFPLFARLKPWIGVIGPLFLLAGGTSSACHLGQSSTQHSLALKKVMNIQMIYLIFHWMVNISGFRGIEIGGIVGTNHNLLFCEPLSPVSAKSSPERLLLFHQHSPVFHRFLQNTCISTWWPLYSTVVCHTTLVTATMTEYCSEIVWHILAHRYSLLSLSLSDHYRVELPDLLSSFYNQKETTNMAECCSEIGTLGIVLLVISLVISVAFGVLCIVGGIFVWRRQTLFKVWGEDQQKERWSYVISTGELPQLLLLQLLALLTDNMSYIAIGGACIIVASVVASFFALSVMVGIGAFTVSFFTEFAVFLVFFVSLYLTYKAGR